MGLRNRGNEGMRVVSIVAFLLVLALACSRHECTCPAPAGRPPVIDLIRDTTAVVGDTLRIPIEAHDPDGDQLHFELRMTCLTSPDPHKVPKDPCPHAGIRTAGPSFWFCPLTRDIPAQQFTILVSDWQDGFAMTRFAVTVVPR